MTKLDLREKDLATLRRIFERFPFVSEVSVFGSRATGHARRASDIDLAVSAADTTSREWSELMEALEEAPIIYELNVVRMQVIQDRGFVEWIEREGVKIYPSLRYTLTQGTEPFLTNYYKAPTIPRPMTTNNKLMFFGPGSETWKDLKPEIAVDSKAEEKDKLLQQAKSTREEIKAVLLSSLQMQHVVVLAGNGTSLGPIAKGPSMEQLWDFCVDSNSNAKNVIEEISFNIAVDRENIEALLSRCEAHVQLKENADVAEFLKTSKKVILDKCSEFIDPIDQMQLAAHQTFLHRLSRRRVRDSRLKLFTTNYDLCFETAAGRQGLVVLDGFSFTQPRRFDPRFFLYDIVRRPTTGDEIGTPLEGVFHLYKLHGSVNWSRAGNGEIEVVIKPKPENACLIYPARGKYQQSYIQPHLELISQYFSALREPNTCLIVIGFGFNDDHLSEPILAAVRTNPHLRLIIVNQCARDLVAEPYENKYWKELMNLAAQGEDVWLLNTSFDEFAEMIPDLKSLTPAQRLARDIKQISSPNE